MLDWLRYFPLKLRIVDLETGLAKGPCFRKSRTMSVNAGDNTLKIKMPKQNKVWKPFDAYPDEPKICSPGNLDILNGSVFGGRSGWVGKTERWAYSRFLDREWRFLNPWFGGRQLSLSMNASVISAPQEKRYDDVSFFHPRVFESALAEYLDARFGYLVDDGIAEFKAPMNWAPIKLCEHLVSVRFDIKSLFSQEGRLTDRSLFAFPVAKHQFIVFTFQILSGNVPGSEQNDASEAVKLLEEIMASIKVELGPQTRAEIEKVKQTCPDMSLTKEFGILKWPIKPEDVGKVAPLADSSQPMPLPKS